MNGFRTRLKGAAIKTCAIFLACLFCVAFACDDESSYIEGRKSVYEGGDFKDDFEYRGGFSVHYLDVGQGDAILVRFADGKTLLIDCGENNERNLKTIERYVDAYATDGTLNYLLLTHPDSDHVGNAVEILTDYQVETAFIPYLLQPENFNPYYAAYSLIKEKGIKTLYSEVGKSVCGDDYYMIMLSPDANGTDGSAYAEINSSAEPSADAINNVSPIIYLDYNGVRFIFTGDAGFSQEKVALNNVDTGFADRFLKNQGKAPVNLTDIDFLKVSHHGATDASGDEFLQRITPKNAIVSVGENFYGHPETETLARILAANENCNLYSTSEYGTVSVFVNDNGKSTVKTAKAA